MNAGQTPSLFEQARSRHRAGDRDAAQRLYNAFLEQNPDHPETLHALAVLALQADDAVRGESLVRRASVQCPDIALYHNTLGHALHQLGRAGEALQAFERAVQLDPAFVDALYNCGTVYLALGMKERAAQAWGAALEKAPQNPRRASDLASLLKMLGRFEQAAALYEWAAVLMPQDASIQYNRFLLDHARREAREWAQGEVAHENWPAPYRYEYWIRCAIAAWLSGQDRACAAHLAQADTFGALIGPGADRNARNMQSYHRYLTALCAAPRPMGKADSYMDLIGDSHVLAPAGRFVEDLCLSGHLIMGAKAWHFAQEGENEYKRQLHDVLARLPSGRGCAFLFGEIDCRADEGLLKHSRKIGTDVTALAARTAQDYAAHIAQAMQGRGAFGFVGVPRPNRVALGVERVDEVERCCRAFNDALAARAQQLGARYYDAWAVSEDGRGHIDAYHLKPDVAAALFMVN